MLFCFFMCSIIHIISHHVFHSYSKFTKSQLFPTINKYLLIG